jgi:hypothetical protein
VEIDRIADALDGHMPTVSQADQRAATVVQILPQLIKNDDPFALRLGFTAADTVLPPHTVEVTDPYPVFVVDLKQLQDLDTVHPLDPTGISLLTSESNWLIPSPPDPLTKLKPARFLYPIKVDTAVQSSVLVVALDRTALSTEWRIGRIGLLNLITTLGPQPGGQFIVWVPALNHYYLGVIHKTPTTKFTITVLFDDPVLHLKKGVKIDALKVFQRLKGVQARSINLNVPNYAPQ